MTDQFGDLWHRFQSRPIVHRLLFVALPVGATVLIALGALAISESIPATRPGADSPTIAPATRAADVATPGAAMLASPSPTVAAAAPTTAPSPTTAPTPEPTMTPTPAPPTPVLGPGQVRRARVANTGGEGANLRREPTTASQRIKVVREGTELEIVGPDVEDDGDVWRNVEDPEGDVGWINGEFLADLPPGSPRPTATPVPPTIQVADITSPVARGAAARLVITTRPGLRCQVTPLIYGPASVPRAGLEPKVADSNGECAWTWTVPPETVPGTWRYLIVVGTGDQAVTREVTFSVT